VPLACMASSAAYPSYSYVVQGIPITFAVGTTSLSPADTARRNVVGAVGRFGLRPLPGLPLFRSRPCIASGRFATIVRHLIDLLCDLKRQVQSRVEARSEHLVGRF